MPPSQRKLVLPPRPPGSIHRAFVLNAGPKLKNVKTRDSLDCMDVVEWAAAKIGARMEQAEEGADPFRSSAKWILVTKWRRIDGWKEIKTTKQRRFFLFRQRHEDPSSIYTPTLQLRDDQSTAQDGLLNAADPASFTQANFYSAQLLFWPCSFASCKQTITLYED
ncbi:hypothetical protein ABKN59_007088 [Abortiporus biennis]